MTNARVEKIRSLITERFKGSQILLASALGRSPAQVYQWLSERRVIGNKLARDIESKLSLPSGWLDVTGDITNSPETPQEDLYAGYNLRGIPKIDACQVRAWVDNKNTECLSVYVVASMSTIVLGDRAFTFEVKDDSMEPDILKGTMVIIDPDVSPTPGCLVAAYQEDGVGICRLYSVPEINEAGEALVELVPLNRTHYPILKQGRTPFTVAGRIVQSMQVRNHI